jgi:hypothetical protein
MNYINSLCVDQRCRSQQSCWHLGPQGQHCYFYAEKVLCDLLDLEWHPHYDLDYLLSQVRDKLDAAKKQKLPTDKYTEAILKAEKDTKLPVLHAFETDKETT